MHAEIDNIMPKKKDRKLEITINVKETGFKRKTRASQYGLEHLNKDIQSHPLDFNTSSSEASSTSKKRKKLDMLEQKTFLLIGTTAKKYKNRILLEGGLVIDTLNESVNFVVVGADMLSIKEALVLDSAVEMQKQIVNVEFLEACFSFKKLVSAANHQLLDYNRPKNAPLLGNTLSVTLNNNQHPTAKDLYCRDVKQLFGTVEDINYHDCILQASDGVNKLFANKSFLAARSNYFYAALQTKSTKKIIKVEKLGAAGLHCFVEYLHTLECTVQNPSTIVELLDFLQLHQEHYDLSTKLLAQLDLLVEDVIKKQDLVALCDLSRLLKENNLLSEKQSNILTVMEKLGHQFTLKHWDGLPREVVESFLRLESLPLSECNLFCKLFRWALLSCKSQTNNEQGLSGWVVTDKSPDNFKFHLVTENYRGSLIVAQSVQKILVGLLDHVRFENITPEQVAEMLEPIGYFTDAELIDIVCSYFASRKGKPFSLFETTHTCSRPDRFAEAISTEKVTPTPAVVSTASSAPTTRENISLTALLESRQAERYSIFLDHINKSKLTLEPFKFDGFTWFVTAESQGPGTGVAVYLHCKDADRQTPIPLHARVAFSLVNHHQDKQNKCKGFEKCWGDSRALGFGCFILWDELVKMSNGWLKDNRLTLQVSIEKTH